MTNVSKLLCKLTMLAIILLTMAFGSMVHAAEINFQWGASTGQVDGYRIYCAHIPGGPYLDKIYEGNATVLNCTKSLIEDHEYYFVCRAFNRYGESGNSNEVHWLHELPGVPGNFDWIMNQVNAFLDKLGVKGMRVELMIDR